MTGSLKTRTKPSRCLVCNRPAELHHIKTRGAGGGDQPFNLIPLDREHHMEVHQIGLSKFADKYDEVHHWLTTHGWVFVEIQNKWRHASL